MSVDLGPVDGGQDERPTGRWGRPKGGATGGTRGAAGGDAAGDTAGGTPGRAPEARAGAGAGAGPGDGSGAPGATPTGADAPSAPSAPTWAVPSAPTPAVPSVPRPAAPPAPGTAAPPAVGAAPIPDPARAPDQAPAPDPAPAPASTSTPDPEPRPTSRRARRQAQAEALARARAAAVTVTGPARVETRTGALAGRLRPGDVAVIDHLDLDRAAAEALAAARPAAVLNAARSISGRYPALGPRALVDAGILLVDDLGPDVLTVPDGRSLRVVGGSVYDGETLLAEGETQTAATVAEATAAARSGLATQLESFAANGMEHLRAEQALLLEGEGVPALRTAVAGRPALVVVGGVQAARELREVRPFVREHHPVLIGVDGGADTLLEAGLRPDMVVGDLDAVSDRALTSGAEVVLRVHRDGRAPGRDRVERLGVRHATFPAGGSAGDVALLLADAAGAELVVGVGTRADLLDLLDAGRDTMAGTVLTRLRVGGTLVDAGAVARLYRHRIAGWQVLLLALAALAALAVALAVTPAGQDLYAMLGDRLADLARWVRGLFGGTS